MSNEHNGTSRFESALALERLPPFEFDPAEVEEGADQSISQSQPLQPNRHPEPDYASPSPMITSSQYATPRLSPRSTVGASPGSSHWAPSPGLMITTSQAASPAFIPLNPPRQSLPTAASILGSAHPGINWIGLSLDQIINVYDQRNNADQPITNNSQSQPLQPLQPSHHPSPDHAWLWSYDTLSRTYDYIVSVRNSTVVTPLYSRRVAVEQPPDSIPCADDIKFTSC